ncbi:hypothetical protein ACA910_005307 [Epithemia clementina (nom. ined.)]
MAKLSSIFNLSCGASVLMALYIGSAGTALFRLMYPLAGVDQSQYEDFVHPLWNPDEEMHLRVYLSTSSRFDISYLQTDFWDEEIPDGKENADNRERPPKPTNSALLWEEVVSSPAFSKSFLLTSIDCSGGNRCLSDDKSSFDFATSWLDRADQVALERGEGGVVAAMSAAGQGIESTSVLLSLYYALTKQIRKLFIYLSLIPGSLDDEEAKKDFASILDRQTVSFPPNSKIWGALTSNSTVHVHVLVLRKGKGSRFNWPPENMNDAVRSIKQAQKTNSLLMGGVGLVKYDLPHHVGKPRRLLYRDLVYWWNRIVNYSREMPPWVMEIVKPEETMRYKLITSMKERKQPYPYWKPEVSVKYVNEVQSFPYEFAGTSGLPVVRVTKSTQHPTGLAFAPAIHVDEIGLTIEKYIPLNETVKSLPLRISFDRSGMSPARWRLLSHLSEALERQQQLGFDQSDIDEIRSLIADTNVTLLLITLLASALHLLFEFLTFKNEVSFWQNNKDLTGLSVRALFMDLFGQVVILLFLIEKESSLLITVPAGIGCLIALWKCRKAAGLKFVKAKEISKVAWYNWIPRLVSGYELCATRLEIDERKDEGQKAQQRGMAPESTGRDLTALTIESDRLATRTIGVALLPLVVFYTCYSLVYEEHKSWLSWLITSTSSGVYAFGFVMMTPQLFLNWKLKSVAHLPWRVLCYKFLNTFIDDLFSFIVRMPTMARLGCFRDDIVFFIYLYQRWLYPVDTSRPAEGFSEAPDRQDNKKESGDERTTTRKKKTQ